MVGDSGLDSTENVTPKMFPSLVDVHGDLCPALNTQLPLIPSECCCAHLNILHGCTFPATPACWDHLSRKHHTPFSTTTEILARPSNVRGRVSRDRKRD
ncbi:hypothetical protein E2C01_017616 [Portunus trituberculatus]|uniref:Uncharacterized protein n=1 Tax=Portunus trituberculatus TaxID=210409 RepID=A0A5B7DU82_PORTR|nr:hypothetical protein [Portunus trituberculatus]